MSFYLFRRYFLSMRSGSLIKFISWLCLAGIAVSISALLLITSIMGGFGKSIKSRLLDKQAHLIIDFEGNPFKKTIKPSLKQNDTFFDSSNKDLFFVSLKPEQLKQIKNSVVFETQELILKTDQGFKGVSARGYSKTIWNQKKENSLDKLNLESQALEKLSPEIASQQKEDLSPQIKPLKEKSLLISYDLALEQGLSKGDDLVFIPLAGLFLPPHIPPPVKTFKVAGISPHNSHIASSVFYKQGAMDFGVFSQAYYKAEIQLYQPEQAEKLKSFFKNFKVSHWMDQNSNLLFALKLERFIMTLFFIIALIISCLGISSALFLLITQKGEDIAILQAMGLSQKEITKVFTRMGLYLAVLGLFIGAFIGLGLTFFLKYNRLNILPEMYEDRTLPTEFMPGTYLIILTGTFILAWIFCYLPSRYFSRMNFIDILKLARF